MSVRVAGRTLHLEEGLWLEGGVEAEPDRIVVFGSPAWIALVDEQPELAELERLREPVILRAEGKVLRFEHPSESP